MLRVASASVVPRMESLFNGGCVAGLSDRQLIERFTTRRDSTGEAAFAALVARHGPMVLSVCRQLLSDRHGAEDAFQAVFLVFARKARSIRDPELLGNWLYGVALRTARKAKVRLAGWKKLEKEMSASRPAGCSVTPAFDPVVAQEQAEALHDELGRLPAALRLPVVLCYFEGLTIEEAARRLRWPHGTVRSRLARARDKLRHGLERRGVVLPAGALAATLTPRPTPAALSCQLCDMTASVATQFAAGRAAGGSAFATALGREMLKSMLLAKLKLLVIGFLFLGAVATGAGFVGQAPDRQAGKPDLRHGTAKGDDANLKPGPGRMVVVGRVLTPTGSPAPNAMVMIYASLKWAGRGDGLIEMSPFAVGQAASDGSGRFRLDAMRTTTSRHYQVGAVAIAPGYGAGWVELDPDSGQPAADITLRPEQVIRGRLFDVQGRPAQGVDVSVESMGTIVAGSPDMTLNETVGPYFFRVQPGDLPAWPDPAKSDADGRFTIRGAGRNIRVGLAIDHPKFARQRTHIDTDEFSKTKNLTMAVEPARIVSGRVTYADSGKPAPHAVVGISIQRDDGGSFWAGDFETDAEGRFHANPGSGHRYLLSSFPPEREPYLNVGKNLDWPQGGDRAFAGPGLAPGHPRPRPGYRGGLWQTDRGGENRLSFQPGSGPSDRRLQYPRGVRVGRVVSVRCHARSGLSHRPGAGRGLRAPRDWPANGPCGQTGRAPHLCPRLPQARSATRQREPGSHHHAPAEHCRKGPGRRAGRPARAERTGDQPRDPPAGLDCLAVLDGGLPRLGERWVFRGARPGRRDGGARLFPGCGAQPGSDRVSLRPVGLGRTDHRPPPTLRRSPGPARRPRW